MSGSLEDLPTEVDLAGARIVRESLTNVSRHSAAESASLTITRHDGNIVIKVEDDGPGVVNTEGSGFGVQGMRERAVALGGSLEAGPRPGGGFLVVATLKEPS
ncbi:MAG: hypothetical protein HOY71_21920 [Nonomuraea sp.]|nr:hypothetical protein [Nonomuraea sp.]